MRRVNLLQSREPFVYQKFGSQSKPIHYGLGAGFLAAGVFAVPAGAAPPLLSKVKESLALKGKRRTDCSPVVLRVTSTRRLLAKRTVSKFFRNLSFSAGVRSGSSSSSCLTSASVRFCSSPYALVSM